MRVILFYFSGTGNTWWVSSQLKKELESLGNTVEMYSLENPALKDKGLIAQKIKEADHVIVGYPIYGSDLPAIMKDFVDDLPSVSGGKGFSAFCTQAAFSGDGSVFFKGDMEKKGYNFLQSFQINMTTNFNVAMLPFSLSKPAAGKKLEKIKVKASKKIKEMAKKIAENKEHIEGRRFYQVLMGRFQRSYFRQSAQKLTKLFQFAKERCVKCGLCARTCPTENIVLDLENLDLRRKDKCILCFRCYNFCPNCAINYGKRVKDVEKCKRYKGPIENLKVADISK